MDKKNMKKYLNGINEIELKSIFRNYEKIKSIKIPGFNYKTIEKVPRNLLIKALLESNIEFEKLLILIKKYYLKTIDYSKYEDVPFECVKNNLYINNVIPIIAYYLLNSDQNIKDEIEKFIEDGQFEKLINECVEKSEEDNVENKEENNDKVTIKELENIISKLNVLNADLKNKNGLLRKKNKENRIEIKQLNQQNNEFKIEIAKLNKSIEELNISYRDEHEKTFKLNKLLEENEQKMLTFLNDKKNEMEKHKIGVLQDVEFNEDRGNIYVVSNNHADELINRFEKFETIYVLERSVSEGKRRKLLKKEKEFNKKILRFINEDKFIKEIIEGKI